MLSMIPEITHVPPLPGQKNIDIKDVETHGTMTAPAIVIAVHSARDGIMSEMMVANIIG